MGSCYQCATSASSAPTPAPFQRLAKKRLNMVSLPCCDSSARWQPRCAPIGELGGKLPNPEHPPCRSMVLGS